MNREVIISCEECYGGGIICTLCGESKDGNRCRFCNKFTKTDVCYCGGAGEYTLRVGDEINVYVSRYDTWNESKGTKELWRRHNVEKTEAGRIYYGVITKITKAEYVYVDLEGVRGILKFKPAELRID